MPKVHNTVLEVNLGSLLFNLNYYRSKVAGATKFIVMVKAFSYGSGGYEVAKALENAGVDYLGVASADAGVGLRQKGIKMPIIVMNPAKEDFENLLEYRLELEVYSLPFIKEFSFFLQKKEIKSYPVHLKLDTGMHRLGVQEEELPELLTLLQQCKNLKIESIFSHLAASDEARHDKFTLQQIGIFVRMSTQIVQSLSYSVLRHILNSAGIERFPQYAFDMVRLGLGIYGVNSTNRQAVKTVNTLKTKILQVKNIKAGETIGYSRNGKALKDTKIAIIAIGYADGYLRILGNGNGNALINNVLCPTIGNISMDMTAIDITGVKAQAGDTAILFGESPNVYELAEKMQTIPYEVFTSISRRVRRVFC